MVGKIMLQPEFNQFVYEMMGEPSTEQTIAFLAFTGFMMWWANKEDDDGKA